VVAADFSINHRGTGAAAAGFLKFIAVATAFFFEDIEKVHKLGKILVFTSETL